MTTKDLTVRDVENYFNLVEVRHHVKSTTRATLDESSSAFVREHLNRELNRKISDGSFASAKFMSHLQEIMS